MLLVVLTGCATIHVSAKRRPRPIKGNVQRSKTASKSIPQKKKKQAAQPKKAKPKVSQETKDRYELATITLHYLILTLFGAVVMIPMCLQFGIDPSNNISKIMNPSLWGNWKRAGVVTGVLINLCAALSFAYFYTQTYKMTSKYPFLKHSLAYFGLCLEGALVTFLFFYISEKKQAGGLEWGIIAGLIPVLLSIACCAFGAHKYFLAVKKQREEEAKAKEAARKEKEEKKGLLGKIFSSGKKKTATK